MRIFEKRIKQKAIERFEKDVLQALESIDKNPILLNLEIYRDTEKKNFLD